MKLPAFHMNRIPVLSTDVTFKHRSPKWIKTDRFGECVRILTTEPQLKL